MLPTLFFRKAYIAAHTRRLKSGKTVQVAAHYDKRTRKGTEHATGHGQGLEYLDDSQRALFERMHKEQHMLHHYHGHALRKKIAALEAEEAAHAAAEAEHEEAGRHLEAAKAGNKRLAAKAKRLRHQRELADIDAKVSGIGAMMGTLAPGAGKVADSTDETFQTYSRHLGVRWKEKEQMHTLSVRGLSFASPVAPLSNAAGSVTVGDAGIKLDVTVTPDMRAKGIQSFGAFLGMRHDPKLGDVIDLHYNGGKKATLTLGNKPELRALVENRNAINDAWQSAIKAKHQAQQQAEQAKRQPLIDAMHAEAESLRANIPPGAVPVSITKTGDADGIPIYRYEAGGVELPWTAVNMMGTPVAILPGALSHFAEEPVGYTTPDKIDEQKRKNADAKARKEANEHELLTAEIPEHARQAYRQYDGDADAAWEQEDETAYGLIMRWGPYIQAQDAKPIDPRLKRAAEMIAQRHFDTHGRGRVGFGEFRREILEGKHPDLPSDNLKKVAAEIEAEKKKAEAGRAAASTIAAPEGYQVRQEGDSLWVYGPFDDDLHARIKRAGGRWDGATGTNKRAWVLPVAKGETLKRVMANWTKTAAPKAADDAEARNLQKINQWLGWVEEKAHQYLYQNGVDTLKELGIHKYPALQARLDAAIAKAKAAKAGARAPTQPMSFKEYLEDVLDLQEGLMSPAELAEARKSYERRVTTANPKPAARQTQDTKPTQGRHLYARSQSPKLGVPIKIGTKHVVYTGFGQEFRISEDHPSIHGSHLLGHEGERGRYAYFREATPDEIERGTLQKSVILFWRNGSCT